MIARAGVITNFSAAEKQILFWRDHLDIAIEQMFAPIKLTRDQHVIARAFGRGSDVKIVQSRGSGKTWLVALCCAATCVLYPGTVCAVVSGTAAQATIVLQKLKLISDQNPNLAMKFQLLMPEALFRSRKIRASVHLRMVRISNRFQLTACVVTEQRFLYWMKQL